MSNFLINLALRGAGLPAGQIDARPPVREYQAPSENLNQDAIQDQIVETSDPAAFEPDMPASETTPALRAQTLAVSQESQESQESNQLSQAPPAVLTSGPARLIQRKNEASSQTANPLALTRAESPAPSVVDQRYSSDAGSASRKVVRQVDSPVSERTSSPSAPIPPLRENTIVAMPRSRASEQSSRSDIHGSREPSRAILSEADDLQIALGETQGHAPEGQGPRERQPERDQLSLVTLTPRLPVVNEQLTTFANVTPAPSADVASQPIHVRINRVEVRTAPATAPPSAPRVGPAPIGFGSYYRLRTYRS